MMKYKYISLAVILSFFSLGCDFLVTPEGEGKTDTEQEQPSDPGQDPEVIPDPEETGEFNIIAWSDITNDGDPSDCEWKFQKLLDADFNIYLGWFDNADKVELVLSTADKVGIIDKAGQRGF